MKKIIVTTTDGNRISRTFKGANVLKVFVVEKGRIINKLDCLNVTTSCKRRKFGEILIANNFQDKNILPVKTIKEGVNDCEVIICRKMDRRTWKNLGHEGIEMIFTTLKDAEAAVRAYVNGKLEDEYMKIMYE